MLVYVDFSLGYCGHCLGLAGGGLLLSLDWLWLCCNFGEDRTDKLPLVLVRKRGFGFGKGEDSSRSRYKVGLEPKAA